MKRLGVTEAPVSDRTKKKKGKQGEGSAMDPFLATGAHATV